MLATRPSNTGREYWGAASINPDRRLMDCKQACAGVHVYMCVFVYVLCTCARARACTFKGCVCVCMRVCVNVCTTMQA